MPSSLVTRMRTMRAHGSAGYGRAVSRSRSLAVWRCASRQGGAERCETPQPRDRETVIPLLHVRVRANELVHVLLQPRLRFAVDVDHVAGLEVIHRDVLAQLGLE